MPLELEQERDGREREKERRTRRTTQLVSMSACAVADIAGRGETYTAVSVPEPAASATKAETGWREEPWRRNLAASQLLGNNGAAMRSVFTRVLGMYGMPARNAAGYVVVPGNIMSCAKRGR